MAKATRCSAHYGGKRKTCYRRLANGRVRFCKCPKGKRGRKH